MHIRRLILREILHRKLNFLLAVLAVVVAVGAVGGEMILLLVHDIRTEQILADRRTETEKRLAAFDRETEQIMTAKEKETRQRMAKLEDDYRKITIKLGFNILIVPKTEALGDLYSQNYSSTFMPEEYVHRLSQASVITIQHLLPILEQPITWDERNRKIILDGVRGEVPIARQDPKLPMIQPVPKGKIILGHELWNSLNLKIGDTLTLKGKTFTVHQCYPERGNKDDVTAWIDLAEAQEILGRKGQINAIMALDCVCTSTALADVRTEIEKILPDTQVREFDTRILVRAEARQRAAKEALDALAAEKTNRENLRTKMQTQAVAAIEAEKDGRTQMQQRNKSLAAWIIPLIIITSTAWIMYLAFINVRERKVEIGILRTMGLRSRQILALFFGRALLVGSIGSILGIIAGIAVGVTTTHATLMPQFSRLLWLVPVLIIASSVVAALATWVPAAMAVRQDPAVALRQE